MFAWGHVCLFRGDVVWVGRVTGDRCCVRVQPVVQLFQPVVQLVKQTACICFLVCLRLFGGMLLRGRKLGLTGGR